VLSTELNQPPSVKTTAALFQQLCYENKDRLMAGIIVGGWDAVDKASLYSIPLGGACGASFLY
jgi:20S proteasome subunit beta 1